MLNFTGNTKRRVVNLGNSTSFGRNLNYLEQQRALRAEKEAAQAKEVATGVIQKRIRGYLDVKAAATEMATEWKKGPSDFDLWIKQLEFLRRKYLTRTRDYEVFEVLYQQIQERDLNFDQFRALVNTVAKFVIVEDYNQITLKLLRLLFTKSKPEFFGKPSRTYPSFISFVENLNLPSEIIFKVNISDAERPFLRYLCKPIPKLPKNALAIVRNANLGELCAYISGGERIEFLNNYINMNFESTLEDLKLLENIISELPGITTDEESVGDAYLGPLLVRQEVFDNFQKLYTADFIRKLIENDLNITLIASLFRIMPENRSKISMFLTITKGAFNWFNKQIKDNPVYKKLLLQETDYLKRRDFPRGIDAHDDFWNLLCVYAELISYWLTVSTDDESFDEENLKINQAVELVTVFKAISLTLIFYKSGYLKQLKEISTVVLNQFYTKNLRMKFLPESFFVPKQLTFNARDLMITMDEVDADPSINDELYGDSRIDLSKLEVLNSVPFFVSFRTRVEIFQRLIEQDRQQNYYTSYDYNRIEADVRRENILEDAFMALAPHGSDVKHQLSIKFFNQHGGEEVGIDGGGITKEFLTGVVNEGFNPITGLFKETADHELYPNKEIFEKVSLKIDMDIQHREMDYLQFLGTIMGKCFYENVLIDVSFAPFFLTKWCNKYGRSSIDDLKYLDEELLSNLMKLLQMSSEELDSLDLNFTVDEILNGQTHTFEIIPGGKLIQVNKSNKLNYIHQVSNFKLNTSIRMQTQSFLKGLNQIIDSSWLNMFDPHELQMLISGGINNVNILEWKENVEYGGYLENDSTVKLFWEVVEEMSNEEHCKLIKFVTSVGRAPLLGFGSLDPKFGIRNSGSNVDRLPTASTCVNLLKLPDYKDKRLLKEKLLYSINNGAGFEMS